MDLIESTVDEFMEELGQSFYDVALLFNRALESTFNGLLLMLILTIVYYCALNVRYFIMGILKTLKYLYKHALKKQIKMFRKMLKKVDLAFQTFLRLPVTNCLLFCSSAFLYFTPDDAVLHFSSLFVIVFLYWIYEFKTLYSSRRLKHRIRKRFAPLKYLTGKPNGGRFLDNHAYNVMWRIALSVSNKLERPTPSPANDKLITRLVVNEMETHPTRRFDSVSIANALPVVVQMVYTKLPADEEAEIIKMLRPQRQPVVI